MNKINNKTTKTLKKGRIHPLWNKNIEEAKTGEVILLDVGLPWAVVGAWNTESQEFVYADYQLEGSNVYWECWFENVYEKETNSKGELNIKAWTPLPEVSNWKLEARVKKFSDTVFKDGV